MNLDHLMSISIEKQASDVHVLIQDGVACIRWRCFGLLSEMESFINGASLANRIKIAAELNIAETRRVQEGQFNHLYQSNEYCIRVSIMNSEHGEKFALRILTPFINRSLDTLGMNPHSLSALKQNITQPYGLILVCGATGSGKTTTLYSCLSYINDGSRTIYTIEDPVEQPMASLYQFEPDPSLDISTHDLLKAFMRQDPDVIMVGEIRDAKTADLAISAALTGHLVMATLHTNSALNIVHRCKNWNVDFFALVSTLKLVIHQSMQYIDGQQMPIFNCLQPRWDERLPACYEALIEQPTLWDHLEGNAP